MRAILQRTAEGIYNIQCAISRRISEKLESRYARRFTKSNALYLMSDSEIQITHVLFGITIDRIVEAAMLESERLGGTGKHNRKKKTTTDNAELRRKLQELEGEVQRLKDEIAQQNIKKGGDDKTGASRSGSRGKNASKNEVSKTVNNKERSKNLYQDIEHLNKLIQQVKDDIYQSHLLQSTIAMDEVTDLRYVNPELRPYLRLPRYHTASFFLMHPENAVNNELRKTVHLAPLKSVDAD